MSTSTPSTQDKNKKSLLLGVLFFMAAVAIVLLATKIIEEAFWKIHADKPQMNVGISTPILILVPISLIYFLATGVIGASANLAITITIFMVAMAFFGNIRHISLTSSYFI